MPRILVVDDENGVRQSFNMVLKDDYHVLLAGTGQEAMDIFKKNSVDLILLDILLPDINGLELLEKFVETDPNTEIIIINDSNQMDLSIAGMELGAFDDFLIPLDLDALARRIREAVIGK